MKGPVFGATLGAQHVIANPVALMRCHGDVVPEMAYTVLLTQQKDIAENGLYDVGFIGPYAVFSRSGRWLYARSYVGGDVRRRVSRSGRALYGTRVLCTDRPDDKLERRRVRSLVAALTRLALAEGEKRGFRVVYMADVEQSWGRMPDESGLHYEAVTMLGSHTRALSDKVMRSPFHPIVATRRPVMNVVDMLAEVERLKVLGVPHGVAHERAYEKAMGLTATLKKALPAHEKATP